ncbi:MAG: beta-galactosidase [Candidatus Saccharimonadales bacterium]
MVNKFNAKSAGKLLGKIRRLPARTGRALAAYWRGRWWHKLIVIVLIAIVLFIGTMYGVARWYIYSQSSRPTTLGVSFIPDYARYLGVNPKQTMDALINDLHVRNFRLTSYWSDIEPTKGQYNFSQLDWEFAKANAAGAKVTLSIGLRQPRWPECHAPSWINTAKPESQWQPQLKAFMKKVINRYKNNPALQSYQLENEYFNGNFGDCHNSSHSRLISEFNLVKKLDSSHPIIISRSNNSPTLIVGQPQPDIVGVSVYRKVWNDTLYHGYFNYPLPAWYYASVAGWQKIFTGKPSIIHELQAEPWPPHGQTILQTSLKIQNQTLNAKKLKQNANFAKATGIKTIYFWGAEYWYYRWQIEGDKSVWNAAQQIFKQS